MKVGDIVKVSKYHSLKGGEGRFFKKQYVNKKVVAIEGNSFAVMVKDTYIGYIRLWQDKKEIKQWKPQNRIK